MLKSALIPSHWLRCFIHRLISPMHQTCTRLLLNSSVDLLSDKIALLKIKFDQENCQQKDTPLTLKQMSRRMIDSPRCFIVLFRSSVESSMHRCTHQCDASVKSTDE